MYSRLPGAGKRRRPFSRRALLWMSDPAAARAETCAFVVGVDMNIAEYFPREETSERYLRSARARCFGREAFDYGDFIDRLRECMLGVYATMATDEMDGRSYLRHIRSLLALAVDSSMCLRFDTDRLVSAATVVAMFIHRHPSPKYLGLDAVFGCSVEELSPLAAIMLEHYQAWIRLRKLAYAGK